MHSVNMSTLVLMSRDNECVSVRFDSIICEPLQCFLSCFFFFTKAHYINFNNNILKG